MATVLVAYSVDGRCVRRCDAQCHNAKNSVCECICGGANHGVGLEKALENARGLSADSVHEYQPQHEALVHFDDTAASRPSQMQFWPDLPNAADVL